MVHLVNDRYFLIRLSLCHQKPKNLKATKQNHSTAHLVNIIPTCHPQHRSQPLKTKPRPKNKTRAHKRATKTTITPQHKSAKSAKALNQRLDLGFFGFLPAVFLKKASSSRFFASFSARLRCSRCLLRLALVMTSQDLQGSPAR